MSTLLNRHLTVKYLACFALFLIVGSVIGDIALLQYGHSKAVDLTNYLFNVSREGSLPSYFSALILLFSAVLLSIIYLFHAKEKAPFANHWRVLAIGFLLMSFDEAISIHELLVSPVRKLMGMQVYGIWYYAWIVPALVLILCLLVYFYKFLRHLRPLVRTQFLLSAALFLGGCIGFEMLGGSHVEHFGTKNLSYVMFHTLEESFEMAGIIYFIHSLLGYMHEERIQLHVHIG